VASTVAPFSTIEWRFSDAVVTVANDLVSHNLRARDGAQATLAGNLESAPLAWFADVAAGDLHLAGPALPPVAAAWRCRPGGDDFDREARDQARTCRRAAHDVQDVPRSRWAWRFVSRSLRQASPAAVGESTAVLPRPGVAARRRPSSAAGASGAAYLRAANSSRTCRPQPIRGLGGGSPDAASPLAARRAAALP
jgi:hypothetical protein